MNITISKANNCLCLHSRDIKFVEYVAEHGNEYRDFHTWNGYPKATDIFCYDIALFEVMRMITQDANMKGIPVTFDVE